ENDTVIHYRSLEAAVWAAAAHLRRRGIAPGDVVGVSLPHSALYLVAVYALARIGAVQVSLPLYDPHPMRAAYAARFGVKWVVASDHAAGLPGIGTAILQAGDTRQSSIPVPADLGFAGGDHPWFIRRTSGTTNEAKGIAITHRTVLAEFEAQAACFIGPNDRYLAVVEMGMVYGLGSCERTLFGGGAIVIPPMPFRFVDFFDHVDRYGITRLMLTPNHFDALLPLLPKDGVRCSAINDVTAAGMMMRESLRSEIRQRFSPNLSIRYGSNEAGYLTSADAIMQQRYPETIGAAMPGVELEIVDEHDMPVSRGEPGRIRVRTPWMATGSLNLSGASDRVFRDGWAYPGDIGVLSAEGMLFLKGRADDMMNFDGVKIMPTDIEEALLQHPAVVEAAAFPASSQRHQNIPMAAVTVRAAVTPEALLAYCRRLLGARAPLLISIEQTLPRNAMGKVLKRELSLRLADKLPASMR
ncbi:MAG: class I adenylate-forming enzyme family protein, partial [Rhodospirillales bacterium]